MSINDPTHPLFSILQGHILHCTSVAGYNRIYRDGYIRANDGSLPYTWGQTEGSCVHKLGGISLLDFGLPENKVFFVTDQDDFHYPWEDILFSHDPLTIILKINRKNVLNKLITWETIAEKTEKCLLIPFTEVCCMEPIPVETIEGLVAVETDSQFFELPKDVCFLTADSTQP